MITLLKKPEKGGKSRAQFTYMVMPGIHPLIIIVDLDTDTDPFNSVTNQIEHCVDDICKWEGLQPTVCKIVYRDSEKEWSRWDHGRGSAAMGSTGQGGGVPGQTWTPPLAESQPETNTVHPTTQQLYACLPLDERAKMDTAVYIQRFVITTLFLEDGEHFTRCAICHRNINSILAYWSETDAGNAGVQPSRDTANPVNKVVDS